MYDNRPGFTPLETLDRKYCRSLRGFTLIELMVVVIIIGIMTAIAVPTYNITKEKALDREAVAALKLVQAANKQYFSKYQMYFPAIAAPINSLASINDNLSLDIKSASWAFEIQSSNGATTYIAKAERGTRNWSITQSPSDPTCAPAGSCYN